jgi:hypothetical protein
VSHTNPLEFLSDDCDLLHVRTDSAGARLFVQKLRAVFGEAVRAWAPPEGSPSPFRAPPWPLTQGTMLLLDEFERWNFADTPARTQFAQVLTSNASIVVVTPLASVPALGFPDRTVATLCLGEPAGQMTLTAGSLKVTRPWPPAVG